MTTAFDPDLFHEQLVSLLMKQDRWDLDPQLVSHIVQVIGNVALMDFVHRDEGAGPDNAALVITKMRGAIKTAFRSLEERDWGGFIDVLKDINRIVIAQNPEVLKGMPPEDRRALGFDDDDPLIR